MPTSYDLLFQAIHEEKAVSFTYDKDPDGEERTGLPYVLGRSPDSETGVEDPVVLIYQYDGYTPKPPLPTPHPHVRNWRCFLVDSVHDVEIIDFAESWEPFKMTGNHRKRQNCVEIRVKWRNP